MNTHRIGTNGLRIPASQRDGRMRVGGANGAADGPFADAFAAVPSWYYLLSVAGAASGAYHGYKRNDSVGWAIGWALLGSAFPIITIPVSIAQGFGERKR